MGATQDVRKLTAEERHLIQLLRRGPQSVTGLAEALCISPEQTQEVLQSLDCKVGVVRLFRYEAPCYGLAE
jgi:hypothetical protein